MSSDLRPRWSAVPRDALAWRDWGGEVVVFNQETGSTHLLGDFAVEVLRRLVENPGGATVDELAEALAADNPAESETLWAPAVGEVLTDFARLGLARRLSS